MGSLQFLVLFLVDLELFGIVNEEEVFRRRSVASSGMWARAFRNF
jgi:hypothetical protein